MYFFFFLFSILDPVTLCLQQQTAYPDPTLLPPGAPVYNRTVILMYNSANNTQGHDVFICGGIPHEVLAGKQFIMSYWTSVFLCMGPTNQLY